jgi:hypothetical protein
MGSKIKDVLIEARARRLEAAGLRAALPYLRSEKSVSVVMRYLAEQEARAAELEKQIEELAATSPEDPPGLPTGDKASNR